MAIYAIIGLVFAIIGILWTCNFFIWEPRRKLEAAHRQAVAEAGLKRHEEIRAQHEHELQLEQEHKEKQRQKEESLRKNLELFQQFPTSSTNSILGRRILKQIKMVAVDNYVRRDHAEHDFFLNVHRCGGNGVINMKVRRHKGGYISIQGDAVLLES